MRWLVLCFCLLFVIQGIALLPYAGLQTDEALFASVLYQPLHLDDSIQIFQHKIPVMMISYLGSLKPLLYAALFRVWAPSLWSVRLPMILAGAAAVWLFYLLLRDTLGRRAAVTGAALLATDTTFLLTTTFDWGPVALQHLLAVAGMLLVAQFYRSRRDGLLAAAFFLFGLGLWDKAIFSWMLSGLGLAALLVFPRELRRAFSPRRAGLAFAMLCLGALPLIVYNFRYHGPTFQKVQYEGGQVPAKARFAGEVLDGGSLFGYLVREDNGHRRVEPPNGPESLSLTVSDTAGRPRTNLLPYAGLAALLLLPVVWRTAARRAALFALAAMLVAWIQMAVTRETGGSTHHVVLLWPLPHLAIAAVLAEASRRLGRRGLAALALVLVLLCGSNLLVTNEYLAQLVRCGPGAVWTDAVLPLSAALKKIPASQVVLVDWGMLDSIRLLNQGSLPLNHVLDLASKEKLDGPDDLFKLKWMVAPDHIFIAHTRENEVIPGAAARFEAHASRAGYHKQSLALVRDAHGRAVFEVFRFEDQAPR